MPDVVDRRGGQGEDAVEDAIADQDLGGCHDAMRQDMCRALAVGHKMMQPADALRRLPVVDDVRIHHALRVLLGRTVEGRRADAQFLVENKAADRADAAVPGPLVGKGRVAAVAHEEGTPVRPLLAAVEELVVPVGALAFAEDPRVAIDGPADGLAAFGIDDVNPEMFLPLFGNRGLKRKCLVPIRQKAPYHGVAIEKLDLLQAVFGGHRQRQRPLLEQRAVKIALGVHVGAGHHQLNHRTVGDCRLAEGRDHRDKVAGARGRRYW